MFALTIACRFRAGTSGRRMNVECAASGEISSIPCFSEQNHRKNGSFSAEEGEA
jgi:hypothetical protein